VLASWLVIGLLLWLELNFLLLPMITGFMLVSPLLAVGFYENARRLEAGEAPRAGAAIAAFRRDGFGLAVVGGALLLALYGWLRVTMLVIGLFVLALVLAMVVPDGDAGLDPDMRTLVIPLELVVRMGGLGIALGAILAAAVFGLAAISLPMLVERRMNPLRAVWISLRAVTANAAPAALWAVLTTGLTLLAMLPGFLGFTLAMPVLGYATWHAYRAMVEAPTLAATASGA
jgi:uncharacterized membrane protein